VHNVSQWPNLRQLGEPLGGAKTEGLLEAVSFKKATESSVQFSSVYSLKWRIDKTQSTQVGPMGRGRVANARWE